MKTRGKYDGGHVDYSSGETKVQLTVRNRKVLDELQRLSGKDVDIEIKVHREIRSTDQNAYFHVMVGELAAFYRTTTTYMKNKMVLDCGAVGYEKDVDGCIRTVVLPEETKYMESDMHLEPYSDCMILLPDGRTCNRSIYLVKKGTRMLDTAEFSALIELTKEACEEAGLPTDPPEIEAYMERIAESEAQRQHYHFG